MAAWLVQLRTRLLQEAAAEVEQLRTRLGALQAMRALAGWLEQRPQPGHEVFARGRRPPSRAQSPEIFGVSVATSQALDVVELLWASLALFDDAGVAETITFYRPVRPALYDATEARKRILQRLEDAPDGARLDQLLPDVAAIPEAEPQFAVRRRSAWSSTFIASLELARQGEVVLGQQQDFQPIHVARVKPSH
jgi:segregation and condensation protein A